MSDEYFDDYGNPMTNDNGASWQPSQDYNNWGGSGDVGGIGNDYGYPTNVGAEFDPYSTMQSPGSGPSDPTRTSTVPGEQTIGEKLIALYRKDPKLYQAIMSAGLKGTALQDAIDKASGAPPAQGNKLAGALSLAGLGGMAGLMFSKPGAMPTANPGGVGNTGALGRGAWNQRVQSVKKYQMPGFSAGGLAALARYFRGGKV